MVVRTGISVRCVLAFTCMHRGIEKTYRKKKKDYLCCRALTLGDKIRFLSQSHSIFSQKEYGYVRVR